MCELQYGEMAQSALFAIHRGTCPGYIRFLKDNSNERPAFPKTNVIWDGGLILRYLISLSVSLGKHILVQLLSRKVVILLLLLARQQRQVITLLDICNMMLTIYRGDILSWGPGDTIKIYVWIEIQRLCHGLYTVCDHCIQWVYEIYTVGLRSCYHTSPHMQESIQCGLMRHHLPLDKGCVDLNIFSLHETWGAASSKVVLKLTLATIIILKTAGWSEESICREHYKREIDSKFVFEQAILGQNQTQTARVHVVVCW